MVAGITNTVPASVVAARQAGWDGTRDAVLYSVLYCTVYCTGQYSIVSEAARLSVLFCASRYCTVQQYCNLYESFFCHNSHRLLLYSTQYCM